jgi:hypothetical protein
MYYGASTAGEGYARGVGSVIAAQGQRNLSNSQAAINLTDARSSQIDNQVKSVNAYWEKKDIYSQHQQQQDAAIAQQRAERYARNELQPLTPQEFDRTSGKIAWLKVLEQPQYDEYRNKLEALFEKRAEDGYLSSQDYVEATAASKEWRTMMGKQRDEYPAPILSQMVRFVLKLDREMDDNLS